MEHAWTHRGQLHRLLLPVVLAATLLSGCSEPFALTAVLDSESGKALSIAPTEITAEFGEELQFHADGGYPPYRFDIEGEGSMDAETGTFTAPAVEGTVTVTVTDTAEVVAATEVTIVPDAVTLDRREAPVPGADGITVTGSSDVSIDLTWDAAADTITPTAELEYLLVYADDPGAIDTPDKAETDGTPAMDWSEGTTTGELSGLLPKRSYAVSVLVRDAVGTIAQYPVITEETTADGTVPTVATRDIEIVDVGIQELELSWHGATDNGTAETALAYRLLYAESDVLDSAADISDALFEGTAERALDWSADTQEAVVTGLKAASRYWVNVQVRDETGNVTTYRSEDVYTAPDEAPTAGGGLTVTADSMGFDAAALSWDPAQDDVTAAEDLEYSVYQATVDEIGDYDAARDKGTQVIGWTAGKTAATRAELTGALRDGRTNYLNVVVRDEAGNTAAYETVAATTTARIDLYVGTASGEDQFFANEALFEGETSFGSAAGIPRFDNAAEGAAIADIDGDGVQEVVRTQPDVPKWSWYRAGSDWSDGPAFSVGNVFTDGTAYRRVVAAEIFDSGRPDLVLSGQSKTIVLENTGDDFASTPVSQNDADWDDYQTQSPVTAVGDLDGDGDADLIFAGSVNARANVAFLNQGGGLFRSGPDDSTTNPYSFGADDTRALAIARITVGDTDPDVIVANAPGSDGDGKDILYVGSGNGTFTAHADGIGPIDAESTDVVVGDIDGDGDLDLVIARAAGPIAVYRNNDVEAGGGSWELLSDNPTAPTAGEADNYSSLVLADLNADGDPDLAAVGTSPAPESEHRLAVWENDGNGTFSMLDGFPRDLPAAPRFLAAAVLKP
jgi:hypothetical protein